jgi:zinc transporter ZupT
MDDQQTAALIAALALAAVHLFAPRLRFLTLVPRTSWLSAAGGVSVAYVFVHLLPELAEGQAAIEGEQAGPAPPLEFLEHHVYLVALIGLGVFYGVEKHSLSSRRRNSQQSAEDRTSDDAFWLGIASFAVYNALIGYLLLHSELEELTQLTLYTVAIGVHFVINDVALREHHCDVYRRVGRWLISGAVLVGWIVGIATDISERALALIVAFIAGGIVLNVLKEELPRERLAQFWPFAAGALAYTVLLQLAV